MIAPWKPAGYTSVAPYLMVPDASVAIDFLVRVFDAHELARHPGPNGRVMHAELRIDDTVVMMAEASAGWPQLPAHVHVYVSDVDECHSRALAAGAESVQAPVKKDDPDRRGGFAHSGVTWWIATHQP
jgi:uncharacterized glyoxalase superfamily protein PhnB